jgi:glucan phosphoethanolaminetransferase (alkaline phosphatase superfamily)
MASVLTVLALAVGTFWLEAPKLIRQNHKRELAIFIMFLLTASVFYILLTLEIVLPNPFKIVAWMFGWIG